MYVLNDSLFVDCICKEFDVNYTAVAIIAYVRWAFIHGTIHLTTFIIAADSGPRIAPGTFLVFAHVLLDLVKV